MLNNKILISVIIPYFKKKKFIFKTINSVLNQSYKNLEVIIIYDDKDLSDLKFIKSFSKKDKRIKIYLNKKNLGASKSRNIGVKKSKGYYIAFIDSDDLWHKKKIEKQINFLNKNKCNICHTSYEIIDKNNFKIGFRKARNFTSANELLTSCDIGLSTVLIKKSLLNKNLKFPQLKTKEDFVLWLKLLSKGNKILAVKENLVKWRKINNALSDSLLQKLVDGFRVYYIHMNFNILISFYYLLCLSLNYLIKRFND